MLVGVPGLGLSPDVLGRVLRRLAPPERWRTIAPATWTAHLAAMAPRGRAITLAAGAHMVPLTHPGLLIEAVIDGGGAPPWRPARFGPVTAGTWGL